MCSVSWQQKQSELLICFNRDEQKSRAIAEKPKIHQSPSTKIIMPTDPDGGGSWISVNQFGLLLGLVNFYQADVVFQQTKRQALRKKFISRGILLSQLAGSDNLTTFSTRLSKLDLKQYRPFKILLLSVQDKRQFQWDGMKLLVTSLAPFISSSSFQSEQVLQYRQTKFNEMIACSSNIQTIKPCDLIQLHSSHSDRKDAYSICMHRKDAETVSLSLVNIDQQRVTFQYWDGSPCCFNNKAIRDREARNIVSMPIKSQPMPINQLGSVV